MDYGQGDVANLVHDLLNTLEEMEMSLRPYIPTQTDTADY